MSTLQCSYISIFNNTRCTNLVFNDYDKCALHCEKDKTLSLKNDLAQAFFNQLLHEITKQIFEVIEADNKYYYEMNQQPEFSCNEADLSPKIKATSLMRFPLY